MYGHDRDRRPYSERQEQRIAESAEESFVCRALRRIVAKGACTMTQGKPRQTQ